MKDYYITRGEGRTALTLDARSFGEGLIVAIYNENQHIGAVAVGEYDHTEQRASTSVITRPGHKDDAIAQPAAHLISKHTRKPSCVIAGVHLDNISAEEIQQCLANADLLVEDFLKSL